jgi:hypothetical protein
MQLHAVNKKKTTKEFMDRKRISAEKESKKHHPIAQLRVRDDLDAGEGDLRRGRQKAFLLDFSQIRIRDGGCGLANSY